MAKQTINIGSAANDGTGSTLRESFDITNDNFTELYGGTGGLFHKIEGTNFTGSLLIGHTTTGTLSSALNNTGIGIGTLDALTSGDDNVAVGTGAAGLLTVGSSNVAIGHVALASETGGSRNVAIGQGALNALAHGGQAYNVAVGYQAGVAVSSGIRNVIIGALAGDAFTTSSYNIAIGYAALSSEDTRGGSVAIGHEALTAQAADADTYNVAVGYEAGHDVSTGIKNTLIGKQAGDALTTGSNNIVIGSEAAASAVDVSNEVTIGNSSIANVRIPSDSTLKIGASGDLQLEHLSSNSFIKNTAVGDLYIENQVDDGDVIFRSDDGSGGLATYFKLDGGDSSANPLTIFPDNARAGFGASGDLQIYHDASNSYIKQSGVGNLIIEQNTDDADIIFQSDDGSSGVGVYFLLDGSLADGSNKFTRFLDRSRVCFGDAADLQIYHDGTSSIIINGTGHLDIKNDSNDADIRFMCDDGSGGTTTYFFLDGSTASGGSLYTQFPDNSNLTFGAGNDLRIYHNGTNSNIENFNGALQFVQNLDDGDINFLCDDGSGGVATYITIDGGNTNVKFSKDLYLLDNVKARIGTGSDLQIYHNASNSIIENFVGDLILKNSADDKDILFQSDDGSGGTTTYFQLDGSALVTNFPDNSKLTIGSGNDLQIYHDGSNSYIDDAGTGTLYVKTNSFRVRNSGGSEDIIKALEDGAVTLYYDNAAKLATASGGVEITGDITTSGEIKITDSSATGNPKLSFYQTTNERAYIQYADSGEKLIIDSDSSLVLNTNNTARLTIDSDGDATFTGNIGAGSDTGKFMAGASNDLQIYHDGNNSFIQDQGTGNLYIDATSQIIFRDYGSAEEMAKFINDGAVELYHDNSKKFETTSTGATVTGTLIAGTGDLETSGVGYGLVLKSPNGTRYRVTVDNSGNLSTAAL